MGCITEQTAMMTGKFISSIKANHAFIDAVALRKVIKRELKHTHY